MPVLAVERQREHALRPPFEAVGAPVGGLDCGRAAPRQHVDHLLEQMLLRLGRLARQEFQQEHRHEVAAPLEMDEGRVAPHARPRRGLDIEQIDAELLDDRRPLAPAPQQIGVLQEPLADDVLRVLIERHGGSPLVSARRKGQSRQSVARSSPNEKELIQLCSRTNSYGLSESANDPIYLLLWVDSPALPCTISPAGVPCARRIQQPRTRRKVAAGAWRMGAVSSSRRGVSATARPASVRVGLDGRKGIQMRLATRRSYMARTGIAVVAVAILTFAVGALFVGNAEACGTACRTCQANTKTANESAKERCDKRYSARNESCGRFQTFRAGDDAKVARCHDRTDRAYEKYQQCIASARQEYVSEWKECFDL